MIDTKKVRADFPILDNRDIIYLDNAATTFTPRQVTQKLTDYYNHLGTSVHRGTYNLANKTTEEYENSRRKTADFINASSPREIVFTKNCTEALNLLAYSLNRWQNKGGKILVTEMDHHSNILPWQIIADRSNNFRVEYVNATKKGRLDLQDYRNKLTSDTVVVSFPAISNVMGTINPVRKIAKLAHDQNALVIVDGAQWLPHGPLSLLDYDIDFMVFSAHKMLGPTGLGILYGKKELLSRMPPPFGGGEMVKSVTKETTVWNEPPQKFEAGTPPIAEVIAFGATLDYLNQLDMSAIKEHVNDLTHSALNQMSQIPNIKIYGPGKDEPRGGLISFNLEPIHPHDLAAILDSLNNIAVRAGHHCAQPVHEAMGIKATVRASFYVYNTEREIEKFIAAIQQATNML